MYDVRSISFAIWHKDGDIPSYFNAEYRFFNDHAYDNLLKIARQEFGEPDDRKYIEHGTVCKWYINDIKTISVTPYSGGGAEFNIKYIFVEN